MKNKRIVIVGAGPAGIAAAYTLAENSDLEVILIEQGKRIEDRKRENEMDRAYGFGGVGAYSDGKFIFETILGRRQIGTNLNELIGENDRGYLIKAKEIFKKFYTPLFGEMQEISEERLNNAREIARIAGINDMDYIVAHDYHVGTDRLPVLIKSIQDYLECRGVQIINSERVIDFTDKSIQTSTNKSVKEYQTNYTLISPGRGGSVWLQNLLNQKRITHSTRAIDIGFRIETDSAVLKHLTDIERDVKLEFRHPNGDLIRTFCVCPYGEVSKEGKKPEFGGFDFCLVNGASASIPISDYTNFALLVRMPLRENGDNAKWAMAIAQSYKAAGVDKIIVHRMGDLKQGRSSKKEKIKEWRIKPTLNENDYMPGDVRIGMPARIMDDLRYGIDKLCAKGLMEGLNQDSTLLYGPEIKMHGIKIATDEYLQSTSMNRIYFAGDGTGFSRGIGGAMASGIRAAEGILKEV